MAFLSKPVPKTGAKDIYTALYNNTTAAMATVILAAVINLAVYGLLKPHFTCFTYICADRNLSIRRG